MKALCIEDVEKLLHCGCTEPGCDHDKTDVLIIHSSCHKDSPVDVVLSKGTGVARLICRKCGKKVIDIAIARTEDFYLVIDEGGMIMKGQPRKRRLN